MSRHLSEILLIQIVATYLVILGHSYPFVTEVPAWIIDTRTFIYCFHMPLFVWTSGYLLVYSQQSSKTTVKLFAKKRFLKLLIPYIILSLFAIVPKFFMQSFLNDSVNFDAMSIMRMFFVPRENVWGHFWFLPMIFILGIIGFGLDKLFNVLHKQHIGWLITTLIAFLIYCIVGHRHVCQWFGLDDLISFGWVFALGAHCCNTNILNIIKLPPPHYKRNNSYPHFFRDCNHYLYLE